MGCGMGTGLIGAVLMIALAQGYGVLRKASQEKGPIKRIGMVIGFVIIVLSGAMIINKCFMTLAVYTGKGIACPMAKPGCGMMKPHHMMPLRK